MKYKLIRYFNGYVNKKVPIKYKLVCEYFIPRDSESVTTDDKICNSPNWPSSYCITNQLCWLILKDKNVKDIKKKNIKWAVQNLQSDNRIDRAVAQYIVDEYEIHKR